MAIEGPLKELGLEDVLQLLDLTRKTGVLTVRSDVQNDEAVLHFDRGVVVFAHRRRSTRRLGQQLLRAGKLTEGELERALAVQRDAPDRRLGEVLLELGSVEREELERQLRFQLEETVYDLMGWSEGHFRFEEDAEVARDAVTVRLPVESLLMEGARRIDEWSRLEAKVPGPDAVPALAAGTDGGSGPLELRPEEWELLAEIDGERTVGTLASALGRSSFDVAKTIYGLAATGVVEVRERPVPASQRSLGDAVREVESLLDRGEVDAAVRRVDELQAAEPDRPELAVLAGRALARQGRLRAATEAFDRAVSLDPLSAEAHRRLGYAAARIGEFARARKAWSTYLRLAPTDPGAGRVAEGLATIEKLNQILAEEPSES